MHAWIMTASLTVVFLASDMAPAAHAATKPDDARFRALYTREWAWRKTQFPDVDYSPLKPIEDHLAKVDAQTQAARLHYWEGVMAELKAIKRDALSPDEQVNYDVYRPQIEVLIANQ